ncbi:MAG: hypothetical protein JSU96_02320 [Acidobacteriota bacterium]|nr:MAG: hypothetical protein JSU96_02320 [Acidobacteriota bacterium]
MIQSVIEKLGIPTTSVTLLREVTEKVNPPRALFVDRPLGYPLGEPDNPNIQRDVLIQALSLLELERPMPFIVDYTPSVASGD